MSGVHVTSTVCYPHTDPHTKSARHNPSITLPASGLYPRSPGTSGACMSRVGSAWHQQLLGSPPTAVCGMHCSGLLLVGTPMSHAGGGSCFLQGQATSSAGASRTSCMQCPVLRPGACIDHPVTKQLQLLPSRPQCAGLVLSVSYRCQCYMICLSCGVILHNAQHHSCIHLHMASGCHVFGRVCWAQHIPIHLHQTQQARRSASHVQQSRCTTCDGHKACAGWLLGLGSCYWK